MPYRLIHILLIFYNYFIFQKIYAFSKDRLNDANHYNVVNEEFIDNTIIITSNSTDDKIIKDRNTLRTLNVIQAKSSVNRLVLVVCIRQCTKQRNQIHHWVQEYNLNQNFSEDNYIFFHFYNTRGKTFPYYEINEKLQKRTIAVVYFVASKAFHYDYDVDHKNSFMSWISKLNTPLIYHPIEWYELDELVGNASECYGEKKYVLLVHDLRVCYEELWENAVRSLYGKEGIVFIEILRPLLPETEVVLTTRLPRVSQRCSMTIILHKGGYVELPEGLYPHELHQAILNWSHTTCDSSEPFAIKDPLTDIQLEYLREERAIKNLERNPTFIVVGAIGGIAVVALAISIFWGLNGSSFT